MSKRHALFVIGICIIIFSGLLIAVNLANGTPYIYLICILTILTVASLVFIKYSTFKILLRAIISKIRKSLGKDRITEGEEQIYPVISDSQYESINSAYKLTFCGDLILLKEAVERAYRPDLKDYDFTEMFKYVGHILQKADLAIGVFEGPTGGECLGYSTSNYDDNIELKLNFPDSFAKAVKNAGFDLVSLANNHLADVGVEASHRTMNLLKSIGLSYVGAYRNKEEYERIKIINFKGYKVAVLAYTYGFNYYSDEEFIKVGLCKPVFKPESKYFKQNIGIVREDFRKAREAGVDSIWVIPHLGEQFLLSPDKTQRRWADIFVELGADLILSDHTHSVQPLEWRRNKMGKQVLIVYCPGNFVNSYTEHNGDASMLVNIYLNRKNLQPIAASVVPLYAWCPQNGQWAGVPVKSMLDKENISRADYRRVVEVLRLVCETALGAPIGVDNLQDEYFTFPDTGYVQRKTVDH